MLGYIFPNNLLPLLLLKSIPDDDNWKTLKTAVMGSVPDRQKLNLSTVETKLAAHAANLQKTQETTNSPETQSTGAESTLKVSKNDKQKLFCKLHGMCAHTTKDF